MERDRRFVSSDPTLVASPGRERQDAKGRSEPAKKGFREVSTQLDRVARATIGAAIAVHRELGPGFLEVIYEQALAIELSARGIAYERQHAIPVFYRGEAVGESRLDFLIEDELVVELKAVEELRQVHRAQVLSYLRSGAFELGLLVNFNVPVLADGIRRVVCTL